jgi:hypothetical protein
MDWLTFISKFVDALAWPMVVLIVFFTFKDKLAELIPFLRKLKIKDIEAEFGAGLREVGQKLAIAPIPASEAVPESKQESPRDQLVRLAENAPRAAVLEAWLLVEHSAVRLIQRANVADRSLRMVGPTIIRKYLDKTEIVTPDQRESFTKLRDLRNKVVHLAEVTLPLDEVISYVDLALSLSGQFNSALPSSHGVA